MLTMQNDPELARDALRAGATGFVLKEAAEEELIQAVRLAAEGRTYLNPELGARLATEAPPPAGAPDDLSAREIEVLRLIALGHTNAEIASQLFLSACAPSSPTARTSSRRPRRARAPSLWPTRASTGCSKGGWGARSGAAATAGARDLVALGGQRGRCRDGHHERGGGGPPAAVMAAEVTVAVSWRLATLQLTRAMR